MAHEPPAPPPPPPFPAGMSPYGPVPRPPGQRRGVLIAVLAGAGLLALIVVVAVVLIVVRAGSGSDDSTKPVTGALKTPIRFQQVTSVTAGACTSGGVPAADGRNCYRLQEPGMTVTDVRSIKVGPPRQNNTTWQLQVSFRPADAQAFGALSAKAAAAGQGTPGNQIAIVVGDKVVSAPSVQSAITGGDLEIDGNFTRPAAERLFRQITTGTP